MHEDEIVREHAVWALAEYGFRVVIAPSFSPIFRANCIRNGVAPVILALETVILLAAAAERGEAICVDLVSMTIGTGDWRLPFELEDEARMMLMEGLDAIELTLKHRADIQGFREGDSVRRPSPRRA